jgi:CubicO group peptidase (beta-lactamase class C family)
MRRSGVFWSALFGAAAVLLGTSIAGEGTTGGVVRVRGRLGPAGLPASTPEDQGMDSTWLRRAVGFLIEQKEVYRPHQVIVLRNGHVVLDACFYPFARGWRHDLASVTKMVTGAVVGAAVRGGYIGSMDDAVVSFFPNRVIANLDARKQALTISHLLEQRSGLVTTSWAEAQLLEQAMYDSPDWVQWILDQPMAEDPGWGYLYTSWNPHLAAAAVAATTGRAPLAYARQALFGPLGIRDVVWPADPQGINFGAGELQLLPEDLAKLGQLYLDLGTWSSRQVLDSDWIERATSPVPGPNPPGWPAEIRVGYHWELGPDYYSATGSAGQVVRVFPNSNLVVVLVAGGGAGYAGNTNSSLAEVLCCNYLTPAIQSDLPLPANPAAVAALEGRVAEAAQSDEGAPQPVPPLPVTAALVSGRRVALEPNPLELYSFVLTFDATSEATVQLESAGSANLTLKVGLDGVFRFFPGEKGTIWRAKGWWGDPSRFVLLLDEIALYNYLRLTCEFDGTAVALTVEDLSGSAPPFTIHGEMG